MLHINYIREHAKELKKSIAKRGKEHFDPAVVDMLLEVDEEWRGLKGKIDDLRRKRNSLTLEITKAKQAKKDASQLIAKAKKLPGTIHKSEERLEKLEGEMARLQSVLPNILHTSVPKGKDAFDNPVLKKVGKPKKKTFPLQNHEELAEKLGIADFDQGREVSGQGFNYLLGQLAELDYALQRYGVDFLLKKGFTLVIPPMMLRKSVIEGAINLGDFEEVIYKIEDEDLYTIASAEHSLVSFFKDKLIKKEDLPIKLCAVTPCFRKEIGAHGVDTKGLFRMHQFNKVEQVVATTEEQSDNILEEMEKISEQFFKSLGIPFQVIEICSGDLGAKMAKQYDIEAWFPRQNAYKEVTSAGSCTNYQSIALNAKYISNNERTYLHLLNNTMVATSRAMVAILENHQQKNGTVKIPKPLQKYMGGKKIIGGKK